MTEGERSRGRHRAIDAVDVRTLFDRSALPMLVADDDRRYVDANDAALQALGLTRDELLGRRVDDLAFAGDSVGVDVEWRRFRREGSTLGPVTVDTPRGRRTFDYVAVANVGPNRHVALLVPSRRGEAPPARLSAREREILGRVALGQDGPEIAAALVVSPATVRTHIGNAVRKLGARSRAHAVAVALRSGLLDDRQLD